MRWLSIFAETASIAREGRDRLVRRDVGIDLGKPQQADPFLVVVVFQSTALWRPRALSAKSRPAAVSPNTVAMIARHDNGHTRQATLGATSSVSRAF